MFVTTKRYLRDLTAQENIIEDLEAEIDDLEDSLMDAYKDVRSVTDDRDTLALALMEIIEQRTPSANATVTRMAKLAEEALAATGLTPETDSEEAEFVTDEPQPEGTLANLARVIREGSTTPTTTHNLMNIQKADGPVFFDWTGLNDTGDTRN